MQYNLLNYGNTGLCPSPTLANKDTYFSTVFEHVLPDVMCVNEMAASLTYADRILANVCNKNGRSNYKKTTFSNTTGSNIVNMLFYNSDILGYISHDSINSIVRNIDIYKLYYKAPNLAATQDTVFVEFILAHLKAGSASADAADRTSMTNSLMSYLNTRNKSENTIFIGDFNLYNSSEQAFQNLINYSNAKIRFKDPVNQIGAWSSNTSYKNYHTQSTQLTVNGTCHSSGGTDDRFDFIMASEYIMGDSANVKYVPGSYITVGNDGLRYNQTATSPANTQVSATVASALYNFSDHYPVTLKLKLTPTTNSAVKGFTPDATTRISFVNPAAGVLHLNAANCTLNFSLLDIRGNEVKHIAMLDLSKGQDIDISTLPQGIYTLVFENENKLYRAKLVIQ